MSRGMVVLVMGALLSACATYVDPAGVDEPAEAETERTPREPSVRKPVRYVPERTFGVRRSKLGRGTLVSSATSSETRTSICLSVDPNGQVLAVDGLSCTIAWDVHECAPDDCPWLDCGGCLLRLDQTSDNLQQDNDRAGPPWILSGRFGSCTEFDGDYQVFADAECGVGRGE